MRRKVNMKCGHSNAPGMDWNVVVSFVGNAKTYRVWSKSNDDRNRVLLRTAPGPLTWRRMVADIKELDEVILHGDFLNEIQVSELPDGQAALLKMAWCRFEGLVERQLEFLLGLPDDTIELLAKDIGDLVDPEVLAALEQMIDAQEEFQVSMTQVNQAITETSAMNKGLDLWVQSMSNWFREHTK